jgi:hypothetical protein
MIVLQSYPQWLDKDAWDGFCEMRRSMPKSRPFTPRAAVLILKKLQQIKDAGHDPNAALDQSTLKGWCDVYVCHCQAIDKKTVAPVDCTQAYLAELSSIKADPSRVRDALAAAKSQIRRVA